MVRYFTDDEEEENVINEPAADVTIESSIMNLMTSGRIVLGREISTASPIIPRYKGPMPSPSSPMFVLPSAPLVESDDEDQSILDTDGPVHDHSSSFMVILVSACIMSMMSVGAICVAMGAYAYPEWT